MLALTEANSSRGVSRKARIVAGLQMSLFLTSAWKRSQRSPRNTGSSPRVLPQAMKLSRLSVGGVTSQLMGLMLAAAKAGVTSEAAATAALPETKLRLFTLSSLARAQTVGGTGYPRTRLDTGNVANLPVQRRRAYPFGHETASVPPRPDSGNFGDARYCPGPEVGGMEAQPAH